MSRSRHRDILRRPAPRCCRTGKSSRRVRGGPGAFRRAGCRRSEGRRTAESISRGTFDNALRCLEPSSKPVRPRFIPTFGYRSEASLVAVALETEPSPAVLARHFRGSVEWVLPSLRSAPPVREARQIDGPGALPASIGLPSFRGRRRHQPDLPPLSTRVDKRPITHADCSRADSAPRSALTSYGLQGRCQKPLDSLLNFIRRSRKRTYS